MSNKAGWIVGIAIVLIAIGFGVWFSRQGGPQPGAVTPQTAPNDAAGENRATHTVQHPISQAQPTTAATVAPPLPPLDASDGDVVASLSELTAQPNLNQLLVNANIIPRIVATIDALPRHKLGKGILPVHRPRGSFAVDTSGPRPTIAAQNYARYAPYMAAVKNLDPDTLVSWYVHYYPLFQQAYRKMGYPNGYFNDRLIEVIDDLLATPEPRAPVTLARPNVNYTFADPRLESLSAGQKMLLRAGPDNEAQIKAKLRAIRAALVGQTLPAAPASSAAAPASSAHAG